MDIPLSFPPAAVSVDLTKFRRVTICTPIWAFSLAAPVRSFCQMASGKIRSADYLLVHHQKNPYWNAAAEMDALLHLEHSPAVSICCRMGQYRSKERKQ